MRLTPGTRVGPYEVVALLGAGGMAEVYRAKDTRLGREVAIKVVSEALGGDGASLERFEREAKVAGSLNHPNIVALHDVGLHDGKSYFVTELLQGETLRQRLAKGPIPIATALDWATQMAKGLAAAHERGIVHRDLKPENVFVTRDGHVKLLDFGIAKLLAAAREGTPRGLTDETVSPSGSSTGTGMVLGTPGYMSPEQVRGEAVDARSDFFSLGAVMYEMLSGHRAFPAGPAVDTSYAIVHHEPEALPASVPPLVTQVVHRCLEKDPGLRFQSARDLAFSLETSRTGTGGTPRQVKPVPTGRFRRWIPWAIALTAIALAAAMPFLLRRPGSFQQPSVRQLTFRRGSVSGARFTPDGRVVYSAAWESEPEDVFVTATGSNEPFTLNPRGARLLAVSPSGELAVSLNGFWPGPGGGGGTLATVPSVGGAPRLIAEAISYADWSRSGELAVVRTRGAKRQVEYPIGKILFTTNYALGFLRVSPDGSGVAFVTYGNDGPELIVADRSGKLRRLKTEHEFSGIAWEASGREVWYSAHNALYATTPNGDRRLIYQGISPIVLQDLSPRGEVLLISEDERWDTAVVPREPAFQREFSLMDRTHLAGLSDDGRQMLVTASPLHHWSPVTYFRPTDGSPALKLGPVEAYALSPDGKRALVLPQDDPPRFEVVPTGIGVPRAIPLPPKLDVLAARWFSDGKRIALIGQHGVEEEWRLYVLPPEGGEPRLLSDEGVLPNWLEVSPDDRRVAATSRDGILKLFPVEGGVGLPVQGLGPGFLPVGWTHEGQLWVFDALAFVTRGRPSRLIRFDLKLGRAVEERGIAPSDASGVTRIGRVCVSADGQSFAYSYMREIGTLYELSGLMTPRGN